MQTGWLINERLFGTRLARLRPRVMEVAGTAHSELWPSLLATLATDRKLLGCKECWRKTFVELASSDLGGGEKNSLRWRRLAFALAQSLQKMI